MTPQWVLDALNDEAWEVHADQLEAMSKARGLNDVQVTGLQMAAGACRRARKALDQLYNARD